MLQVWFETLIFNFFKPCIRQNLLSPLLNTLSQKNVSVTKLLGLCSGCSHVNFLNFRKSCQQLIWQKLSAGNILGATQKKLLHFPCECCKYQSRLLHFIILNTEHGQVGIGKHMYFQQAFLEETIKNCYRVLTQEIPTGYPSTLINFSQVYEANSN